MDLAPLRALAFSLNQSAHGVPAVVTRPAPNNTPVNTTGIWMTPALFEESAGDMQRREVRRVLVVPRSSTLTTLPLETTIVAPEVLAGGNRTWIVEGFDRIEADRWRAIVRQT